MGTYGVPVASAGCITLTSTVTTPLVVNLPALLPHTRYKGQEDTRSLGETNSTHRRETQS
jgi:hypothetical protein